MNNERALTRRTLLEGAAGAGIVITVLGVAAHPKDALGQTDEGTKAVEDVQYGFLMNTSNCVRCENCVTACKNFNHLPEELAHRRRVATYKIASDKPVYVSTACMHCAKPACVEVCPAGAISKGEGGIVTVDQSKCIGCKYCYQACPFKVPQYGPHGMDKCDFCLGNGTALGEMPYCVAACKYDALHYGTVDELIEMAGGNVQIIEAPTEPSCYLTK